MRGAVSAIGDEGEAVEIEPDEDGPLVAYVFKTLADPYTGRINLLPRLPRHPALRLACAQRRPGARRSGSASSASRSARS